MDRVLEKKLPMDIPIIGFSDNLEIYNIVFLSQDGKKFPFFRARFSTENFIFYFYEKNCESSTFVKALLSLQTFGSFQYDIVLKKIRFKCHSLTLPSISQEILLYLSYEMSKVYPLKGIRLNFESNDRYHDCDLHLQDLYQLGYGQFTKNARWRNGETPEYCFLGFILFSTTPRFIQNQVYDFIEFDMTDSFYLRISVYQIYEQRPYLQNKLEKQVLKIIDEIPCEKYRKTELYELFLITKTLEVYEGDLHILDIQYWSPLWLMLALSPILDYFEDYKLNPKINACYLIDIKESHST
jgi:hypothetical protein